jgi:hypothetical protein
MTSRNLQISIRILLVCTSFVLARGALAEEVTVSAPGEAVGDAPAVNAEVPVKTAPAGASDSGSAEFLKMLEAQQQRLAELERSMAELQQSSAATAQEQQELQQQNLTQQARIDDQRQIIRSMQAKIDELSQFDPNQLTDEELALRNRLETLEESISQSQDAASTTIDADSFPGSIPIPGTAAAIRIGGFVKANMAFSFDTIGSQDRFIVASIPTDPQQEGSSEVNLTVSQSRLNFDLRDRMQFGALRAFIEGDFAAEGDLFRLRHAFGQLRSLLVGKTDSAFSDMEARPEELDFEGINGMINVRQTQIRFFPEIGKDWNLITSLEDPQPEIYNGTGITRIPDFIVSVRRTWFERWHIRTGLLLRRIRGSWDADPSIKDDINGWALTLSGKTSLPKFHRNDNLLFQINVGKGYGRYINDLNTVGEFEGGQDGVFDPNGILKALPVFSGYLALQHWWNDALRSTFITSFVKVDTYSFQPEGAYSETQRISGNVIWSPGPRVDVGTELIWGKRIDRDSASGDAIQLQMSAKYRF